MYDYHPNAFILTVAVRVIKFKMTRLSLIKGTPYSDSENQRSRRSRENKGKAYMRDALISRSEKNLHDCKIANLVFTTDTTTFEACKQCILQTLELSLLVVCSSRDLLKLLVSGVLL